MKKTTKNELMKIKEDVIETFDAWNTTDIEIAHCLSNDGYASYYHTVVMRIGDPAHRQPQLINVMNMTEAEDGDTDNGCTFGIGLWDPDGYGDVVFECSEDEIEEACDIVCGWIEEYVEDIERQKNIVHAYNSYTPFERYKEDYTWSEFKRDYDLPRSWTIAAFKKEAKRATIKLIGKV